MFKEHSVFEETKEVSEYKRIMERLREHLDAALAVANGRDWFVIALQGSQNYGLADENSDIDSKFLVIPSFDDIVFNRKPISHTHIMENDEHVDIKDLREYFRIFRKQNINFVEILFTPYYIVNPEYTKEWKILKYYREKLARMNPYAAIQCMKGMAHEKLAALQHPYPSKKEILKEFGYDPKQLHHIARLNIFLREYISGTPYRECLVSGNEDWLLSIKRNGLTGFSLEGVVKYANELVTSIDEMADDFREVHKNKNNPVMDDMLNYILREIMTKAMKKEL